MNSDKVIVFKSIINEVFGITKKKCISINVSKEFFGIYISLDRYENVGLNTQEVIYAY